jgi:hypothetical protein
MFCITIICQLSGGRFSSTQSIIAFARTSTISYAKKFDLLTARFDISKNILSKNRQLVRDNILKKIQSRTHVGFYFFASLSEEITRHGVAV